MLHSRVILSQGSTGIVNASGSSQKWYSRMTPSTCTSTSSRNESTCQIQVIWPYASPPPASLTSASESPHSVFHSSLSARQPLVQSESTWSHTWHLRIRNAILSPPPRLDNHRRLEGHPYRLYTLANAQERLGYGRRRLDGAVKGGVVGGKRRVIPAPGHITRRTCKAGGMMGDEVISSLLQ